MQELKPIQVSHKYPGAIFLGMRIHAGIVPSISIWKSILGSQECSLISWSTKYLQGCFRTHFQRTCPQPLLPELALKADANSRTGFLGPTDNSYISWQILVANSLWHFAGDLRHQTMWQVVEATLATAAWWHTAVVNEDELRTHQWSYSLHEHLQWAKNICLIGLGCA